MSEQPERSKTRKGAKPLNVSPAGPISLKQLAAHLKVDPSTVSVVLNDVPGRSISQVTRARVKAAAKEFNYRPSLLARSLRRKDTQTIGVLLPHVGEEYHAQVLSGVANELERNHYSYLIAQHRHNPEQLQEYIELLVSRGAQGFIAIDTHLNGALHVPVVAVAGHAPAPDLSNVLLNHERAAQLTMCHLYDLGHRRIAFIRGQAASSDTEVRWCAMSDAARKTGIDIPEGLVMQLDRNITSPEVGYSVLQKLLRKTHDFTAVVCFNDIAALGAIRALGDAGLRTPEDISVIGFDDIRVSVFARPSITTIRQPLQQMGETAARILLERLRTGIRSQPETAVEPELMARESTGPARRR